MPIFKGRILREMRLMSVLEEEERPIQSHPLGSTENTEPTKDRVHIPRELLGDWDDFPNFEEIRQYARHESGTWAALDALIRDDDYPRVYSTELGPVNSETMLEIMLKIHFDCVNLALERTALDGRHFMIAGGKSATAGDTEGGTRSEPDRASFLAPTELVYSDGGKEPHLVYCFDKLNHSGATQLRNVVAGEIKLSYKFRRDFL